MLFAKIHVMKVLGMSVRKPTCLRAVESDLDALAPVRVWGESGAGLGGVERVVG
jgi:hypothetical protein